MPIAEITALTSLEDYDFETSQLVDSTHQVITFSHWETKHRIYVPYRAKGHKKIRCWDYYTKMNSIVHFNTLELALAYLA